MSKIKIVLNWIFEQVKMPVILFCMFFFGGLGLYHGVMVATSIGKLTMNSAVVITFIDLDKNRTNAE